MSVLICFFKQKTAYEMRISDWSSDVCSSDLTAPRDEPIGKGRGGRLLRAQFRDLVGHVVGAKVQPGAVIGRRRAHDAALRQDNPARMIEQPVERDAGIFADKAKTPPPRRHVPHVSVGGYPDPRAGQPKGAGP